MSCHDPPRTRNYIRAPRRRPRHPLRTRAHPLLLICHCPSSRPCPCCVIYRTVPHISARRVGGPNCITKLTVTSHSPPSPLPCSAHPHRLRLSHRIASYRTRLSSFPTSPASAPRRPQSLRHAKTLISCVQCSPLS
ncbi:hypothetical protein C8Q70DRAFT_587973 [Cubamyces menziesii]|nr:hypothetical protein C8Q70DRAFT_587973 [Cubamyces menziesii]